MELSLQRINQGTARESFLEELGLESLSDRDRFWKLNFSFNCWYSLSEVIFRLPEYEFSYNKEIHKNKQVETKQKIRTN